MTKAADDNWPKEKCYTDQKIEDSSPTKDGRQTPETEKIVGLRVVRLLWLIEERDRVADAV